MSYTSAALADIHERTHRSLAGMLAHCESFSPEELGRELDGFGHATLREQFLHLIGAEAYWMGVLAGRSSYDYDETQYPTIATLEEFRSSVFAATSQFLGSLTDVDVNRPRDCMTWGDVQVSLRPAHVVLRTQTHVYQHCGQITAMSRLLGRPVPSGLDFPIR